MDGLGGGMGVKARQEGDKSSEEENVLAAMAVK